MNYEEKYWELREMVEKACDDWGNEQTHESLTNYKKILSRYQDFCMDVLEILMEKNADVLKNLKIGD